MSVSKRIFFSSVIAALLALVACVTVNVQFPESVVQREADDYVKELYKMKQQEAEKSKKEEEAQPKTSFRIGDLFIASAWADGGELPKTPEVAKIQANQASRLGKIEDLYKSGSIGESNSGLLEVRGDDLKPLQKKMADSVVDAENEDRESLYKEYLKGNNWPDSYMKDIRKQFTKSYQKRVPKGAWIQDDSGKWKKK